MRLQLPVLMCLLYTACLQAGTLATAPADSLADKSIYTLFNPTPDSLLRDFSPDRPDSSTGARTVDAGRLQLEVGLFGYSRDEHNLDRSSVRSESFVFGDTELRVGLANWIELDLLIPFYTSQRDKDLTLGHTERASGIGDLTVGVKVNFWGNDSKDGTAGGISLSVKTPTASRDLGNGKVEGAAVFLLDIPLPWGFDLTVNHGIGIDADDSGGYHADFINSASISHPIIGPLSAFGEIYSSFNPNHTGEWQGSADFGLLWQLRANLQLDAGMNIGISRAADDLDAFLGISYRF